MKIIYIYPSFKIVGGADRIITQKANYLSEEFGHDVFIITDSQNNHPLFFPLSPKVKHIDLDINFDIQYKYPLIIRYFIYTYLMYKYKKALLKLLDYLKPDIVISTLGIEVDFIHQLSIKYCVIGEAHTTRDNIRNIKELLKKGGIHRIAGTIIKRKINKAISKLKALIVLNEEEKKVWSDITTAVVIPNALTFIPSVQNKLNNKSIIFVGRLEYEKGVDRLIDVWEILHKKYPDWQLQIYGNGTLKEKINRMISQKNLTNLIIHQPINNISKKYIENSIMVLTSRYEGFGLVLIEAMSCGLPCVAYNCPYGPKNIIKNGINGWLIEDGNIQQMADNISLLIENREMREKMGKNAFLTSQKYNPNHIMQKWESLFQSLVNQQQ